MKDYYQIIDELGLEIYPHQENFLTNPKYDTSEKIVGCFMGTDAGKTTTAFIKLAMYYSISKNKSNTSIIFAAARKDTRDNIGDTFNSFKNYFTFKTVETTTELKQAIKDKVQVIIVLPQCANALKPTDLPKIKGWMIYDEAHEWYLKPVVQKLIKTLKPKYQMVMTGTPFNFNNKRGYENYYVSIEELQKMGKSGDADIITVASAYNFRNEDYLKTNDLRTNVKIDSKYTVKTLELVIKQMLKSLKCRFSSNATLPQLISVINKIENTVIYARSREMGNQLYNTMDTLGLNVAYSDSKVDPNSEIIQDFKDRKYQFIIVVDRIKQGFSYNELFNIVDMSLTTKPSVILQMYGRLLRKSKLQPKKTKRYFKVAPKNEIGYIEHLMLGVMNLCTKEFYSKFNNNKGHLPIPRITKRQLRNRTYNRSNVARKTNTPRIDVLQSFSDLGINLNLQNFKSIKHNENKYFEITRVLKLVDIQATLLGKIGRWTLETINIVAKGHSKLKTFSKTQAYGSLKTNFPNEFDDVTAHMERSNLWDEESIDRIIKQINPKKPSDLYNHPDKNTRGAYHKIRKLGLVKKYFPNKWVKSLYAQNPNEVKKEAKKYKSRTEFSKKNDTAYKWARKYKLLDELFPKK